MITDVHVHCMGDDPAPLTAFLKEQGIGHAVLMSSRELDGADCVEKVRRIAEESGGFYSWMCTPPPEGEGDVFACLERYRAQGAVGVGELMVNQWLDSPFLTQIFDAAARLELPVTLHMDTRPGHAYGVCDRVGLPLLEGVLRRWPTLKVLGHSQVFWAEISDDGPWENDDDRAGYGKGPVKPGRVAALLDSCPNLYCDLSAYSGANALLRDEAYGAAFLKRYADRLLFGTDTVRTGRIPPLKPFIETCLQDGRLDPETAEKIFSGNARRLLGV